jgi:TolA-binding protein
LCLLIADLKIIFTTMAKILTSCLEREGQGGHRCIACQDFEEAVQQNASRVRKKKRGDTGKLYKFTNKVYITASPSILHRRTLYSVRGRDVCFGSAATAAIPAVPCGGTPKRNRRSKHSPTHTYKVPTSDEFKNKKHQMCEHHENEQEEQQSSQRPLNLQEKQYAQILTSNTRAGSPITTAPLQPDAPDTIGTNTLKPPTDKPMEFSVSIDPSLVTGAACFNDMVRQQFANAHEEVTRLLDANRFLLTVNSGDANMYANMYEHVLQGKYKRATEQVEAFQAL